MTNPYSYISNMKYYKQVLSANKKMNFSNITKINVNNEDIDFNSSSSCLIPNIDDTGYYMNVRYVNYNIDENGNYHNCKNQHSK